MEITKSTGLHVGHRVHTLNRLIYVGWWSEANLMTVVDVEDGRKWQVKYDDELTCLGAYRKSHLSERLDRKVR